MKLEFDKKKEKCIRKSFCLYKEDLKTFWKGKRVEA